MKYLLDECLSVRVRKILRAAGHDVVHAADLELLGEVDDHVMLAAKRDGRVLISADTDFGELLAKSGDTLPSVVLLRRAGKTPEEQSEVLIRNLPAIEPDLKDGAFATIKDERIRVRSLPLHG
ncbi:DUF5615 family PIN-like protein [Nesterenkonia ebinurensis]|uniref:DUF5615 family PIN-like protein n=1 Tax=Nesterenkonia ebinurensis TaxID=2608252 RepID=UPI00123E331D|nr:DUF5615 family PIN-like protein [Nesterenkonia ebinurensis]